MRLISGLAALLGIAVLAKAVHPFVGPVPLPPFTLAVGMAAGVLVRRTRLRTWVPPMELLLSLGMILLGVQFEARLLAVFGLSDVVRMVVHWTVVGLVFSLLVRRRLLEARTAGLLGVGLSGCGISAVLASAAEDPEARPDQRIGAVTVTLMAGTLGFALLPLVSDALGLDATSTARWAGLAMPTTAEAVLIGAAHSPEAMQLVGAHRFVVNLLQWIPILVYLRLFGPPLADEQRQLRAVLAMTVRRIPAFVWGLSFFGLFGVLGGFDASERAILGRITNWAFLACLVGIGIVMKARTLLALGVAVTATGLVAWLLTTALLLGWAT